MLSPSNVSPIHHCCNGRGQLFPSTHCRPNTSLILALTTQLEHPTGSYRFLASEMNRLKHAIVVHEEAVLFWHEKLCVKWGGRRKGNALPDDPKPRGA